jgi:tetratricopeptide (TPR) repeat protein
MEETLRLRKVKLGLEHPQTQNSVNGLATAYVEMGRPDKVVPLHEEYFRELTALLGAEHPLTIISMNNLAGSLFAARRVDQALPLYEESFRLRAAKHGRDDPVTLRMMISLATAYLFAERLAEAQSLFEETVERRKKTLGAAHPETLDATFRLAWFLATAADQKLRDPPRAIQLARTAIAVDSLSPLLRGVLGIAHYRTGDWQAATIDLELALQLPVAERNINLRAHPAFFLAMSKWQLGEKDEARDWLAKAVKWMEQGNPEDAELKRFRAEAEELIGE